MTVPRRTDKEKQLLKDVFEATKNAKADTRTIEEQAKEHPDRMNFQGVKNHEEFQERYYALYYSMQGEYEKSIEHATEGLRINPKSAYLFYIRGRSEGDARKFEQGIQDLNEAIRIEPNYAEAFIERGYIMQKVGHFSKAKKDYDRAVQLDPSLQRGLNALLNKGNANEDMIIPCGVTFKFVVEPSIIENHRESLKYVIIEESGLKKYFKGISVACFDGAGVNEAGSTLSSEDRLKGKQMVVKVFCPDCTLAVAKNKEEDFYKQVKENFSSWIIARIQSNTERKYTAKLGAFLYTVSLEL